ncbi:hypothetical protein ASD02_06570 [Ensifer sp. Root1252]|jgi:hypothetical protein|nr:hypothetical protein ASD00_23555 [Ensifer sp. Root31]KQW58647.1 hypothetical protein ASD02_06570 [Ensifer sp. Root1252]KQW74353.1 hypothetical protein ASD03_07230 [Ensifer sp. Root127]KQY78686.1 hypothetical protein ASD52_02255 [Ensifer sp. Root142]KRC67483.1 hypothetical protein ASE32_10035 [Ensifer sp. Root231]KRC98560.1 hypothetical protein ASE47_05230 [Ensifer sp. Root258]OMQ41839.1 hypothetical protein BKP54_26770 [Ensifer sp. 1H6]PSS65551.1 hypothetical protein C6558_09270 [Ensifer 
MNGNEQSIELYEADIFGRGSSLERAGWHFAGHARRDASCFAGGCDRRGNAAGRIDDDCLLAGVSR